MIARTKTSCLVFTGGEGIGGDKRRWLDDTTWLMRLYERVEITV
jgi:hypothetical protein